CLPTILVGGTVSQWRQESDDLAVAQLDSWYAQATAEALALAPKPAVARPTAPALARVEPTLAPSPTAAPFAVSPKTVAIQRAGVPVGQGAPARPAAISSPLPAPASQPAAAAPAAPPVNPIAAAVVTAAA